MEEGKNHDLPEWTLRGRVAERAQKRGMGEKKEKEDEDAEEDADAQSKGVVDGDIGGERVDERNVIDDRERHVDGNENHDDAIAAERDAVDKRRDNEKENDKKIPARVEPVHILNRPHRRARINERRLEHILLE